MPNVKNLFTDYNGTLEPRYLEIPLAYELLAYHKEQGNTLRYLDLLIPQKIRMCVGFLTGGKQKLLRAYVTGFLKGEERKVIEEATEKVQLRKTNILGLMKKLLGEKRIFGKPDPKAKELFRRAKEEGMTTGIYTLDFKEFVLPALKNEGLLGLFDFVKGNEILYSENEICCSGSKVDDFKESVPPGKGHLGSYISGLGHDPQDSAFIDDEDMEPLMQVRIGIASPTSKKSFKDECRKKNLYTPASWGEVGEIIGIKLD